MIYCYDRITDTYSRIGKLLYGVATTSYIKATDENGTRLISFGGEALHGFKGNSETAVQIATVRRRASP